MFKNVFGSNGGQHIENQFGNMRYDPRTGKMSYVVGGAPQNANGTRTVIGQDGQMRLEQQHGNVRYDLTNGGFEWLF